MNRHSFLSNRLKEIDFELEIMAKEKKEPVHGRYVDEEKIKLRTSLFEEKDRILQKLKAIRETHSSSHLSHRQQELDVFKEIVLALESQNDNSSVEDWKIENEKLVLRFMNGSTYSISALELEPKTSLHPLPDEL